MHITETIQPNPGYIALVSVEFIEKNVNYALKNPEFVHILYDKGATNKVSINYSNFPYFGHSYTLESGTIMKFFIQDTTGVRIKACNKYDATIEAKAIQNGVDKKTETITIYESKALDFPIIVTGLERGDYTFNFKIESGKFDLEYLLYEI